MSLFFTQKYFKEDCQELTDTSLSDLLDLYFIAIKKQNKKCIAELKEVIENLESNVIYLIYSNLQEIILNSLSLKNDIQIYNPDLQYENVVISNKHTFLDISNKTSIVNENFLKQHFKPNTKQNFTINYFKNKQVKIEDLFGLKFQTVFDLPMLYAEKYNIDEKVIYNFIIDIIKSNKNTPRLFENITKDYNYLCSRKECIDFLNIISEKASKEYLERNYGWLILRANPEKITKAEEDIF